MRCVDGNYRLMSTNGGWDVYQRDVMIIRTASTVAKVMTPTTSSTFTSTTYMTTPILVPYNNTKKITGMPIMVQGSY